MAELSIIGIPQSTYVRVARMAAHEKGVDYTLVPEMPHSDAVNEIHPFGRVPAMRHGDVELCESRAVADYINRAFDGPALISDDPVEAAETEQWISLVNTKMDGTLVRAYLLGYVMPKGADGQPDREALDACLPDVKAQLKLLETALTDRDYLVGDRFSLADMNILPILDYLKNMPESGQIIAESEPLTRYLDLHSQRESFKESAPPPPPTS